MHNHCTPVQPSMDSEKEDTYNPCLEKFLMNRILVNHFILMVDTGLHIDSHLGKQGPRILSLKTSPGCQRTVLLGLEGKLDTMHKSKSR